MRNDLYFHSSNLEFIRNLREDPLFEAIFQYDLLSRTKISEYEWGRIKTPQNYIHLILGNPPQEGCPWCSSPTKILKLDEDTVYCASKYCIQCMKCGSRGPVLNVSVDENTDPVAFNELMELMLQGYKRRRMWDHGKEIM